MVTQHEEDKATGEPGGHVFDVDSIFGVRIVRDADPAGHAAELAATVRGEVVRDLDHAGRAFAARAEAGRAEPVVLTDEDRAELEAAANTSDAGDASGGDSSEATIAELEELADELGMAERIRENTEAEVADVLSRRLSAASTVAIHPDAISQAATAVTDAEEEIATCDTQLAALGPLPSAPRPASWEGVAPTPEDEPHTTADEETAESPAVETPTRVTPAPALPDQPRRRGALAILVGLVFAGVAVLLLALSLLIVAVVVFVVGLVIAAALLRREPAPPEVDIRANREASEVRASATPRDLATPAPKAPGIPDERTFAPPRLSDDEWRARQSQIEQTKERAGERLRSARKHWESLVGLGADPHDVDSILRVRDPQLELVGVASRTSPTVRTVSAVHRRTLARWRVAWAAVGYDDPPQPDDVGEHIARLRTSGGASAEAARDRLGAASAWRAACATIDRPIVLVEPEEWLPEDQLEAMLGTLPAGAEVIIVESDAAGAGESGSEG